MPVDVAEKIAAHLRTIEALIPLIPEIERIADQMVASIQKGGRIYWMGNGGSAADAQHMAAEFVGRFERERHPLPSIALTTDTSILTCIGNDYGFDSVFTRQVEALCTARDVLIGISTSGNSPNIIAAVEVAKRLGVFTVGLTGRSGGKLCHESDLCLIVPSENTARIQEAHILIGHILCEWIECALL